MTPGWVTDCLAGIGQDAVKKPAIGVGQLIWDLGILCFVTLWQQGVGPEVVLYVPPSSLDQMAREETPFLCVWRPRQIVWQRSECGVEQAQKRSESFLLAAVRGRRDENQMTLGPRGEASHELMALLLTSLSTQRAPMRLINDHKPRACPHEFVLIPITLNEVDRHNDVRISLEEGGSERESVLKSADRVWQNEYGIEVELLSQFALPLFREVRWAKNGEALGISLRQQFLGDERRLDRFADANVVGNK
jgi:hypothetical protein